MFVVTLRRANERPVKFRLARSRYAAKVIKRTWEEKYDDTYFVVVEESKEN